MGRAARKQQEIPGTEPERNDALEDQVMIVHGHRLDKLESKKKEAEESIALVQLVHTQIETKVLKIPKGTPPGERVTVYKFERDGEHFEVGHSVGREEVTIRRAKPGAPHLELLDDEETEG